MKATERQIGYLTKLAQRVMKAKGTPGVDGKTFTMAEDCVTMCHGFSKEKASMLIGDFKFLVRSVNTMRCLCNMKQV